LLYLEQLTKLLAEQNLRLSSVASIPHLSGKSGRRLQKKILSGWKKQAFELEELIEVHRNPRELAAWFTAKSRGQE
jgi:hypothetical protein